jgi:hypothetical protein
MSDPWTLKIADFLIQALDLTDDRSELAGAVVPLKRDDATGISVIELDSSIGSAPFLVYHYVLGESRDRLNEDLATLEKAANLNSPGPRIVAHAETSGEAYILATTPSIQRALSGAAKPAEAKSPMAIERARSRVPDRLRDKLRESNKLAGDWLAAIGQIDVAGDERIELTEQEAALALFLLDEGSIQELLTALNVLMNSARHSAADSLM